MKIIGERGAITPEYKKRSDLDVVVEATDNPEDRIKEMMNRHGNIQSWAACVNTLFAEIKTHVSFMAAERKVTPAYETKVESAYANARRELGLMMTAYPYPELPPEEAQKELFSLISSLKPNPEDLS